MSKVFISHSSADKYLVGLIVKILEFHHIETWYDDSQIQPGTNYLNENEDGIKEADSLIVIISNNSLNSKWVSREITTFLTTQPDARVISLIFDPLNLDDVFDGLKKNQSIDFSESMLNGFETLLSMFGKDFLQTLDRRKDKSSRRNIDERRESEIIRRMRVGFWKCYERASGSSKFDDFTLTTNDRMKVIDIIESEVSRYEFFDSDGKKCKITKKELERLTYDVWEEMRKWKEGSWENLGRSVAAITIIEAIAEEINTRYVVKISVNRRSEKRRSEKY
ncbi:MAG: toll/interleukin-1 receptor domain-containing protein [Candidatus Electryoneaceae bacterium]|nr:toll/interleukin-1 receptor domain-containing protein [Candidatus Electryoneaceae bacterium]